MNVVLKCYVGKNAIGCHATSLSLRILHFVSVSEEFMMFYVGFVFFFSCPIMYRWRQDFEKKNSVCTSPVHLSRHMYYMDIHHNI